jgi:hypothetical protein
MEAPVQQSRGVGTQAHRWNLLPHPFSNMDDITKALAATYSSCLMQQCTGSTDLLFTLRQFEGRLPGWRDRAVPRPHLAVRRRMNGDSRVATLQTRLKVGKP